MKKTRAAILAAIEAGKAENERLQEELKQSKLALGSDYHMQQTGLKAMLQVAIEQRNLAELELETAKEEIAKLQKALDFATGEKVKI